MCTASVLCVCVYVCVYMCLFVSGGRAVVLGFSLRWFWFSPTQCRGSVLSGEQGFRRLPSFLYLMISSSVSEIPSSVPLSFSLFGCWWAQARSVRLRICSNNTLSMAWMEKRVLTSLPWKVTHAVFLLLHNLWVSRWLCLWTVVPGFQENNSRMQPKLVSHNSLVLSWAEPNRGLDELD